MNLPTHGARKPRRDTVVGAATLVALSFTFAARGVEPSFVTETLVGRVVFHNQAFEEQTGVPSVLEAAERLLALKTEKGRLVPLLEDVRGRAFRRDERLRDMQVELVVRRYPESPVVQIIRVIERAADGQRYDIDYWCEICAIAMFEQKDCECCQGPVELRRRKVE
jgi:PAS domain-containing protein